MTSLVPAHQHGAFAARRSLRSPAGASTAPKPMKAVTCRAVAEAATAWDSWNAYMKSKKKPVLEGSSTEKQYFMDITAAVAKSAVGYKPKFNVAHDTRGPALKLQHMPSLPSSELPRDLHDRLEVIGAATLKGALSSDVDIDYANLSYTTTDIGGALSVTGTVVQSASDKSAVLVFVATETERQLSWSRLEGLVLHWACTASSGGAWSMPPDGWIAVPDKKKDAGGAWQCQFEKQLLGNNEQLYVLLLQLPLRGILKSGGVVFVLKGTGTPGKADRWLKDSATDKDFFLDLSSTFPITKL